MKKIIFMFMLLSISFQLFAGSGYNPWASKRYYKIYLSDTEVLKVEFFEDGTMKDRNSDVTNTYAWEGGVLFLYDYDGNDYVFDVEFDIDQMYFSGFDINTGLEVLGHYTR